jgi:uncharacterized protein YpiB (UPF0302 family)
MNDINLAKLLNVLYIIDNMEDYIKILAIDFKLNRQDAQELLNYIQKAKSVL